MILTKRDIELMKRFENREKTMYMNYISIGFIFVLALFGLIIGIQRNSRDGLLMALYFGTIALMLTVGLRVQQKLLKIIKKLRDK